MGQPIIGLSRRACVELWRRGRDSNPRSRLPEIPVFETGAFVHSATSPRRMVCESNYKFRFRITPARIKKRHARCRSVRVKPPWQRPIFPHPCKCSIVSATKFHFRVRDGNGWCHRALVTKELLHIDSKHCFANSLRVGSGGRIRTCDLRVMSPTSYHCSTPQRLLGSNSIPLSRVPD